MSERSVRLKTPDSYRDTSVPTQRSLGHIRDILRQFGVETQGVSTAEDADQAITEIKFVYEERTYSITLLLGVDPKDQRQKLRVIYWHIKALLEAIAFGVVSAEEALLPYAEISDGAGGRTTVGKALSAGRAGELPRMNPGGVMEALGGGLKALPVPRRQG